MIASIRRGASWAWNNIGFLCVAVVAMYCLRRAFDPPRLNWGDSGSDYNVMGAGRNFEKYGFITLRLTPHLLDPSLIREEHDKMFIYTHYPQLPDLMNGVERVVFRMNDLVQFRFVALLFSFASLFFIYRLVREYWGRLTAQVGLALWISNPLWIQHADYLHHVPYGAFFGFGSLYFLRRYLVEDRPRWVILSSAAMAFTFLASYDWWFFGPILAMLMVLEARKRVDWKGIRILTCLAAGATAAVAFKLGTNAWVLGGFSAWLRDLRFQYAERATDAITRTRYENGVLPTMTGRVERFFTLLFFPMVVFWLVLPMIARRFAGRLAWVPRVSNNPVWLLVAAAPFLYLFTEMWVAQFYPAMLVVPFYAVGMAAIAAMLWASARPAVQAIGVVLVGVLLANSLDENASFPIAFFPRNEIASLQQFLDAAGAPEKEILVNHVFDAPYRYYFNRKIVGMTLIPARLADQALLSFANPATHPRTAAANGAIFVQHKHVVDELYDKGYYYIFGRWRLWGLWANPRAHRQLVDSLIRDQDSTLMSRVALVGQKIRDTPFYAVWLIHPPTAVRDSLLRPLPAGTVPRTPRN